MWLIQKRNISEEDPSSNDEEHDTHKLALAHIRKMLYKISTKSTKSAKNDTTIIIYNMRKKNKNNV